MATGKEQLSAEKYPQAAVFSVMQKCLFKPHFDELPDVIKDIYLNYVANIMKV